MKFLSCREQHKADSVVFACSPASLALSRDIIEGAHGIQLWDLPDQQILLASRAGKDKGTILVSKMMTEGVPCSLIALFLITYLLRN